MTKFKQIIILSELYNSTQENVFIIKEQVVLEDDNHLILNNDIYIFDYLIFTNPKQISNFDKTNILYEDGIPITNCFYQTTYENIYFVKNSLINDAIRNIATNE